MVSDEIATAAPLPKLAPLLSDEGLSTAVADLETLTALLARQREKDVVPDAVRRITPAAKVGTT